MDTDNIERLAAKWLSGGLPGVAVASEVPDGRPDEFVVVTRSGGVMRDIVVDEPLISVRCWAQTKRRARELCYAASDRMRDWPASAGGRVTRVVVVGISELPDTKADTPRYQLTLQVTSQL